MLEGLFKGLFLWLYGLIISGVEYLANALMDVFQMNMDYFETNVPVTTEMFHIIVAAGWALLIGNMAFQAMKTMASGIGFEGEDPKILFGRTFVFGFLLLASRQICEIGMSISSSVIDLLQVPASVIIPPIEETQFDFDGSWMFVIVAGLIMVFQVVKFFFQIGERYAITAILTMLAPLAFSMGGSKNTEDIFKGWCRMFASMCVMMIMNVIFLKILLSAITTVPSGLGVVPWLIFVVAIGRAAKKMDDIVGRIGLNTARTGAPMGKGVPGMLAMMVAKNIAGTVTKTVSSNKTTASSAKRSGRNGAAGNKSQTAASSRPISYKENQGKGSANEMKANDLGTQAVNQTAAGITAAKTSDAVKQTGQQTSMQMQSKNSLQERTGENAARPPSAQSPRGVPMRPPIGCRTSEAERKGTRTEGLSRNGTTGQNSITSETGSKIGSPISLGRNTAVEQTAINADNRSVTLAGGTTLRRNGETSKGMTNSITRPAAQAIGTGTGRNSTYSVQSADSGKTAGEKPAAGGGRNGATAQLLSNSESRPKMQKQSGVRNGTGGLPASPGRNAEVKGNQPFRAPTGMKNENVPKRPPIGRGRNDFEQGGEEK